jgi:hypothetical protein
LYSRQASPPPTLPSVADLSFALIYGGFFLTRKKG